MKPIQIIVLLASIAFVSAGCFFEPPVPSPSDTSVTLSADPSSLSVGETSEITLTTDVELDCGEQGCTGPYPSIVLEGERETVTPPANVDSLNVLSLIDASLRVIDGTSAELTVLAENLDALTPGELTISASDGLLIAQNGEVVEVDEGGSVELFDGGVFELASTTHAQPENAALETASFTVENVDDVSDAQTITITNGEVRTLTLGNNQATAEIIDVTMSGGELDTLRLRIVPAGALGALYTKELDFTFATGKRIDLGAQGTYDVFLEDVSYEQGSDIASVDVTVGEKSATIARGSSVIVDGKVIAITTSGFFVGENVVSVPQSGAVRVQDTNGWRTLDATGSYETSGSGHLIRITDTSGSDSVFGTYSLTDLGNEVMVTDTLSAIETMADATSVTTYRFNLPGTYTFTGSVREDASVLGEDTVVVQVS